jgi:hypothetical protein
MKAVNVESESMEQSLRPEYDVGSTAPVDAIPDVSVGATNFLFGYPSSSLP